jgi:hypothetical protein
MFCGIVSPLNASVRRMPNVGSIFCVEEDGSRVRYFWCVGVDQSQLYSQIIVVFKRSYPAAEPPDFDAITKDEVAFYCHTLLGMGKKLGLWRRAGFRCVTRDFPMLFRDSADYGDPSVRVSERWSVWYPNEKQRVVGKLKGDLVKAEIGVVFPASAVVERIRTGMYGIQYPSHDSAFPPRA